MVPRLGFIDPSGVLIPCCYGAHADLEEIICKERGIESFYSRQLVRKHGYICVGVDNKGVPLIDYEHKNQLQTETLEKLIEEVLCLTCDEYYDMVHNNVEGYNDEWNLATPGIIHENWEQIKKHWAQELAYEVGVLVEPNKYGI